LSYDFVQIKDKTKSNVLSASEQSYLTTFVNGL
jgi:hypothetical protein